MNSTINGGLKIDNWVSINFFRSRYDRDNTRVVKIHALMLRFIVMWITAAGNMQTRCVYFYREEWKPANFHRCVAVCTCIYCAFLFASSEKVVDTRIESLHTSILALFGIRSVGIGAIILLCYCFINDRMHRLSEN